MKHIIATLILAVVALLSPLAVAQAPTQSPSQTCTSVNPYLGQTAWQGTYTDAKNGAVYSGAVFVVGNVNLSPSGKSAVVFVRVYASVAAAQNSCLQPVDQIPVSFSGASFTSAFGGAITVTSGETFSQAINAQAQAAIKNYGSLATQLTSATATTL